MSEPSVTAGDQLPPEALFERVYGEHNRALHAYFLGRTGDPEAALDLLQETCLRVWRRIEALRPVAPQERRYWLFAVARNVLTDHYRKRASGAAIEKALAREWERLAPPPNEPAARLEEDERLRLLDRAIARLPEELRTSLLLQVLGEMTSAQIGQVLGKPAGTVRYQIALARRRLADEMGLGGSCGAQGKRHPEDIHR